MKKQIAGVPVLFGTYAIAYYCGMVGLFWPIFFGWFVRGLYESEWQR